MPVPQDTLVSAFSATRGDALLDAPVSALAGVSDADAEMLGATLGIRSIRDLADNRFVQQARALVATNAGLDPDRAAEADFVAVLEERAAALLGSQLDGPFTAVGLPSGFNYGVTFGVNAVYNPDTLRAFDSTLATRDGRLVLDGGGFSQLYAAILDQTTYGYSKAAQATLDREAAQAEAQIASVIAAWEQAGGTFTDPLPLGGKLQDIFNQVDAQFGGIGQIPSSLNALRVALSSYEVIAQQSFALGQAFAAASTRLARLRQNVLTPTAANAGLPIGGGAHAIGWDDLPTANQLLGGLQTDGNRLEIGFTADQFESGRTSVQVGGGGASARIPIGRIFSFQIGGGARLSLDRYVTESSSVSVKLTYKGVTVAAASPRRATIDGRQGWYDVGLLRAVVANTGRDATGYRLPADGAFDIAATFGPGKAFSRLKTYVISQEPEVEITFESARAEALVKDFEQAASVKFSLFGVINIGVSDGYRVRTVERSGSTSRVSITMGAPEPSGTTPLSDRIAHVIGGVASYPPNAV